MFLFLFRFLFRFLFLFLLYFYLCLCFGVRFFVVPPRMGRIFGLCFCFFLFLFLQVSVSVYQSVSVSIYDIVSVSVVSVYIYISIYTHNVFLFLFLFLFLFRKIFATTPPQDVAEPCFLLTPPRFLCVFLLRLSVDTLVEVRVRCFHWLKLSAKHLLTTRHTHGRT